MGAYKERLLYMDAIVHYWIIRWDYNLHFIILLGGIMGIFLIALGIIIAIAVFYMVTKVTGGPWSFGFSFELIFIWLFYIFLQIILPTGLIIYGIFLL